MTARKSIVYLGYSAFPRGLAEVQKMILISKSLFLTGHHVTVICRNGTHNKNTNPDIKVHGFYESIEYIYASGSAFRNDSFLRRRICEIKGKINEVRMLRQRKKQGRLDYAILSTRNFYSILFYSIISKLFGFKTILNYVEYYSAMKKNWYQVGVRLNDKLFDKYASSLADAVFPISEFLINHIKRGSPSKKYLKIPVLTDFSKYHEIEVSSSQKYFLFCGDAGYKEVIHFIVDSFELLKNRPSAFLYLVISGNPGNIEEIKKYINNCAQKNRIKLFSRLSEKDLYTYYKNAAALLIPLRPTFQDMARFPHKTGEYLASGNPVISTNYGEIKYYFQDGENMLIADRYDRGLFAEKMQFVIDKSEEAKSIGLRGKNLACQLFNYRSFSPILNDFLKDDRDIQD